MFNKHPRGQSVKEPKIGDIVQVKDSISRGRWRVGNAIKMMGSRNKKKANDEYFDAEQEYIAKINHISLSFGT